MVRLNFDLRGYTFQNSLDAQRRSFALASKAMSSEVERISSDLIAYEASNEREGEWDEDGHPVWDKGQLLSLHLEGAEGALMAFRKATAIAIYHHWERAIQIYSGSGKSARFSELLKRAEDIGVAIQPRLNTVRELANALKHNKGQALRISWPEVVCKFAIADEPEDWYEAIILDDRHITEIFDVVAASGPQVHPCGTGCDHGKG